MKQGSDDPRGIFEGHDYDDVSMLNCDRPDSVCKVNPRMQLVLDLAGVLI